MSHNTQLGRLPIVLWTMVMFQRYIRKLLLTFLWNLLRDRTLCRFWVAFKRYLILHLLPSLMIPLKWNVLAWLWKDCIHLWKCTMNLLYLEQDHFNVVRKWDLNRLTNHLSSCLYDSLEVDWIASQRLRST